MLKGVDTLRDVGMLRDLASRLVGYAVERVALHVVLS